MVPVESDGTVPDLVPRRRWLVADDIRRDRTRLRRVYDVVRSHGERLQYSVFLCSLDPIEKLGLMREPRDILDHRHDRIMFIDLGEPGRANSAKIEFMGTSLAVPTDGPTII